MDRRTFLVTASAAALAPALAQAFTDFTPGLIEKELKAGKTVLIDYSAKWCSTCARQARVIDSLRAENPAYDRSIRFVKVDWDAYSTHPVTTSRNVPRRSTLILLRGQDELGRIIAGTSKSDIKALLDRGLA